MEQRTMLLAISAIATAALGLLGGIDIESTSSIPLQQQEAEARGCENGFPNSFVAVNTSKARCFGH